MKARVTVRQLQQRADKLIDLVAAGERVGITRDGRLVAVLAPPGRDTGPDPDPERQAWEGLVHDGTVAPENAATARGLADWTIPEPVTGLGTGLGSASDALLAMREEEDR
ncbi:type II toxin-antitoxin system Phd/YefM family antitoxin [Kitasatospora sp. NPDC057512]|uniref:type II toxin-antitoxin system Phd/YefM family antitoxin n=1 Tax=Kitasatospora sp. NPDC057512 TaxID=3346154 RepID=UPI0036AF76BA